MNPPPNWAIAPSAEGLGCRQAGRHTVEIAAINAYRVCRSSHHTSQAPQHPNVLGRARLRWRSEAEQQATGLAHSVLQTTCPRCPRVSQRQKAGRHRRGYYVHCPFRQRLAYIARTLTPTFLCPPIVVPVLLAPLFLSLSLSLSLSAAHNQPLTTTASTTTTTSRQPP